jgi:hypothetical protein
MSLLTSIYAHRFAAVQMLLFVIAATAWAGEHAKKDTQTLRSIKFILPYGENGFLLPDGAAIMMQQVRRLPENENVFFFFATIRTPTRIQIAEGVAPQGTYTIFLVPSIMVGSGAPKIPLATIQLHSDIVRAIALPPTFSLRIRIDGVRSPGLLPGELLITGAGMRNRGYSISSRLVNEGNAYLGTWPYVIPECSYKIEWRIAHTLERIELGVVRVTAADVARGEILVGKMSKRTSLVPAKQ